MENKNKVYSISDEEFRKIIKESNSFREANFKLGYKGVGTYTYDQMKKRCKELNISTDHFGFKSSGNSNGGSIKYTDEEIFIKNSPIANNSSLKKRIINNKLIVYKCSNCGNLGEWQGKELSLHLHHINGDHHDNRLENLTFLCPNCHSQTENFVSKNKNKNNDSNKNDKTIKYYCSDCGIELKQKNKTGLCNKCAHKLQYRCEHPDRNTLKELIRNSNFTQIGKSYGVTDNTVRKWCDSYGLPRRTRDIKSYSDEEWDKI